MKHCRICGHELGEPFFSLGGSPLSNSYLTTEQLDYMEPYYPLDLHVCPGCWLVQLDVYLQAEKIFSNEYAYFSSYSDSWLRHCENYVDQITKQLKLGKESFVVEVASNDGYLLQYFKKHGVPVLGVEPAYQTAFEAVKKGIETEAVYFTNDYSQALVKNRGKADLIIGNNVLAHNPQINDFVSGLKTLLKPDGVITMEFPHLLNLIEQNQFDTIYHEHFSYLSLRSTCTVFEANGLTIFDVEELPTHGGSLRIYATHKGSRLHTINSSVPKLIQKETDRGLFNLKTYQSFAQKVEKVKYDFLEFLIAQKRAGKRVAAYGAPAKGNTLLNYCGVKSDLIEFTVDKSHAKNGKYLPGSKIPIYSVSKLEQEKPDYIVILPWNLKDEISSQIEFVKQWQAKFIVAIPNLFTW